MRVPLIAANWKMNKTISQALEFPGEFLPRFTDKPPEVQVLICPPFTSIPAMSAAFSGEPVKIGAQNIHWAEAGAFTGEISASMLKDAGCDYVIIGHSERRQLMGETDESVAKKIRATLDGGLIPLMCVGETLEQREAGNTFEVCDQMIKGGLSQVEEKELAKVVIAYEPVWAIGTGKEAKPEDAKKVIGHIRETIDSMFKPGISQEVRILYGGSVKSSNVRSFMVYEEIDGALVGGASLKPDEFAGIIAETKKVRAKAQ